jgi:hypothetical protein
MKSFSCLAPLITCVALGAAPATAQWSTDSLSEPTAFLTSATVGDLTLFAGGGVPGVSVSDHVDIYDAVTDSWSTASLSEARFGLASTVLGDLVFFAGGATGPAATDTVDVFDSSTGLWSTATLSAPRLFLAATSVGSKAFFAGGEANPLGVPTVSDVVDIYDASLGLPSDPAAWSTATLSVARTDLAATTAGNEALFAGGRNFMVPFDVVDIYDDETGLWRTESLSEARPLRLGGAASTGSVAVFAGGQLNGSFPFQFSDVVDIYDAQSKGWSTETMSLKRGNVDMAAVGDTVLIAGGGFGANFTPTNLVELYDVGSGQWGPLTNLSEARARMGASATSDGRAMFGGGASPMSPPTDTVDIYDSGVWAKLGGSSPGIAGDPVLHGTGSLLGGTVASVSLSQAAPGALALAWISFAPVPFAALGGTVHAFPFANQLLLGTDALGEFSGATSWPLGVPPGTEVWFQFIVQDASSVHGITLSNGLRATAP